MTPVSPLGPVSLLGIVAALADLVLPVDCAGCGAHGAVLCTACAAALAVPPRPVEPVPCPAGFPPCRAVGNYAEPVRSVLLAYKERGLRVLAPALGGALARAVDTAAPPGPVLLVPIPSPAAAVRARGGDHMARLAASAATALRRTGRWVRVGQVLAAHGGRPDSVGLDAASRRANRVGAFRVRSPAALHGGAGPSVVIVDDVVTTGATLAEAAHVLRSAGAGALHAAVVAATVRRTE